MIEDILRVILGIPPTARKIGLDLDVMRKETKDWYEKLIPWQQEKEMELLSFNMEKKVQKQGFDKIMKGAYMSIYSEFMFTFAYKDYLKGSGKNALLQIRTKSHEFVYRLKKKGTEVFVDSNYVAFITREGMMYSARTRRSLARISQLSSDYFAVIVGEKEVGHLLNPETANKVNPRAFLILENMNEQEELLFSAIALIEVVLRTNKLM